MNRWILRVPTAVAIALCAGLTQGTCSPAAAADEPALKLGEERAAADEAKVIEDLVALQVALMKATDPTKRGQHAKAHGCVDATFTVRDDIPEAYRLGIFKEAGSYRAKVRFSNGTQPDDRQPDSHGMAVKVLGVKGPRAVERDGKEEQDFVLADGEEFFAPDAAAVLVFIQAQAEAARKKDPKVVEEFLRGHAVVAKGLKDFVKAPPPSPLAVPYFSSVPFKLGGGAVKYAARPAGGNGPGDAKRESKDYLRAALTDRLAEGKGAATFEFCIVPQTDPVKHPIEDPTRHWDAKPIPVATISIGAQVFDTEARKKECEGLAFDPWNALTEHRPLGGVNRARRAVYEASVKVRR